jgi:hypothetical protein
VLSLPLDSVPSSAQRYAKPRAQTGRGPSRRCPGVDRQGCAVLVSKGPQSVTCPSSTRPRAALAGAPRKMSSGAPSTQSNTRLSPLRARSDLGWTLDLVRFVITDGLHSRPHPNTKRDASWLAGPLFYSFVTCVFAAAAARTPCVLPSTSTRTFSCRFLLSPCGWYVP